MSDLIGYFDGKIDFDDLYIINSPNASPDSTEFLGLK
jgi:hypothetical protein